MSATPFAARFASPCVACSDGIAIGDLIVKDRRAYRHRLCVKPIRNTGAWRKNAEWMDAEDFAVVEEAMSKRTSPL